MTHRIPANGILYICNIAPLHGCLGSVIWSTECVKCYLNGCGITGWHYGGSTGQGQRLVPGDAEDAPVDVDMDQEGEEEPLHMPNGTAPECGYFIPPLTYIFLASLLPLFLCYCFHMFPLFIHCGLFAHMSETADPGFFLWAWFFTVTLHSGLVYRLPC